MTRLMMALGLVLALVGASAGIADAAPATGCAAIVAYAFRPSSVLEGQTATLILKIKDCGRAPEPVSLVQFGREPPGLVLDPVSAPAMLRRSHTYVRRQSWTAPDATGILSLTVNVDGPTGRQLATATAELTITR